MATKDSLEPREADCKSAADYLALAAEALAEPADSEYAKDLLEKAELECQFPSEYVAVAEAAAGAELADYAKEIYEQAEEACFEAGEFAELGHSIATTIGDKEKAREMIEKAAAGPRSNWPTASLARDWLRKVVELPGPPPVRTKGSL